MAKKRPPARISQSIEQKKTYKMHISFGTVMLGRHENTGLRVTKSRPLMAWGGYYDHYGNLAKAAISPLSTAKLDNLYPSDFKINPSFYSRTKTDFLKTALKTEQFRSLPLDHFNQKNGIIRRLKQEFYPDIIYARANALLFNPVSEHKHPLIDFKNVAHYTGPVFTDITIDYIPSGVSAPDVNGFLSEKGIEHSLPEAFSLSQGDIDAIAKYVCAQGINANRNAKTINEQKPIAGTWPNWPDLEWNGETITCCSQETRERMNAPSQPLKTDATYSPSAAAKHAAKFGTFKLG